jgi:tetratricopeptide (TPR) repeat protein
MLSDSYLGDLSMNARVIPSLVLFTLSIVISSCNQSDDAATKEKLATEDKPGINTQIIEALKLVPSNDAEKSSKGPEGPIAKSAAGYINLSVQYYREGEWEKSIEAGIGALNLNPGPAAAAAYNNICAAYIRLEDFDRAILACNEALALESDFAMARNNLNAAIKKKSDRVIEGWQQL